MTFLLGLPSGLPKASIAFTTSMPSMTLPNTWPGSHEVHSQSHKALSFRQAQGQPTVSCTLIALHESLLCILSGKLRASPHGVHQASW